jgi:hypothetical protein
MKPINRIGKGQKSGYCSTGKGQKCPAANLLFLVVYNNFILAALSKSGIKTVCLQKKKTKTSLQIQYRSVRSTVL